MTRSLENIKAKLTLSGTVKNVLSATNQNATGVAQLVYEPTLADGVSANQANRAFLYTADISESGTLTIDLYDYAGLDSGAGAGRDVVGQVLTVEEIVAIAIRNNSSSDGRLEVEPHSTNGWDPIGSHLDDTDPKGSLRPGGLLLKTQTDEDGYDVVDGSAHQILLTAVGGDVNFTILVIGRHDDDESSSSSSQSSSSSSSSSSSESSSSQSSSSSSSSSSLSSSSSSSSSSLNSSSSSSSSP